MRTLFRAVAALMLPLVVLPAAAFAQVDRASVVQQHYDARNRGDVDGALAFFTDDAVFEAATCRPACVGKAAIRRDFERGVDVSRRQTVADVRASGNAVTFRIETRTDTVRAAGVERIVANATAEFRGDKIAVLRSVQDASDPQTATFLNFQRVTGAVTGFEAALNAGDVEGTLARFADNAVITASTTTATGREQVRAFLAALVAQGFRVESVRGRKVEGDKETHTALVSTSDWKRMGIAPLEAIGEATVQGNRITSFAVTYTPESVAKLQAAARATPTQLPRTGGAPAPLAVTATIGMVLLSLPPGLKRLRAAAARPRGNGLETSGRAAIRR
jgi:ketosteroid isomerase-like protein